MAQLGFKVIKEERSHYCFYFKGVLPKITRHRQYVVLDLSSGRTYRHSCEPGEACIIGEYLTEPPIGWWESN